MAGKHHAPLGIQIPRTGRVRVINFQNGMLFTRCISATHWLGKGGLFCQSGRWGRYRSFTSIQTNVEHVNAACTSFGDPNPPNYNALQYQLTCGSRYCSTVLGYGFGMINENGPGYKLDSPYNSDPSAFVSIACAR